MHAMEIARAMYAGRKIQAQKVVAAPASPLILVNFLWQH